MSPILVVCRSPGYAYSPCDVQGQYFEVRLHISCRWSLSIPSEYSWFSDIFCGYRKKHESGMKWSSFSFNCFTDLYQVVFPTVK